MYFSPEKAVLVGIDLQSEQIVPLSESMAELARLADTAGAAVVGQLTQKRGRPDQKFFIGSGKLEELKSLLASAKADLAIFDVDLSASQGRNLETALGCKVIDRTELILDIFGQHARSREGKLQVELAQSSFLLTRLTGHGTQMSRLGGGIGTRGPGETKLEYDRRRIRERISVLKREIEKVRKERGLRREKRRKSHLPTVALIGYTNAGKSTLLNTLSSAEVLTQDKLFATLDPTIRRVALPSRQTILLADTVGFIQKLPHQLIAAFRATLEEVTEAELLLHIVDASHPYFEDQIKAVYTVLEDLNCATKPMITVFNKIDRMDKGPPADALNKYRPAVAVSALRGTGLEELQEKLGTDPHLSGRD
ncbi:GTPase HflX [Candidatus Margulisiibacteriota bacterium]